MAGLEQGIPKNEITRRVEGLRKNEIPVVMVSGENLPQVWENAVLSVMDYGCQIPTQYDSEIDPQSKVISIAMTVAKPLAEPRIHLCIPDSLEGLAIYVEEVVNGVHDNRIGKEKGWSYSYHDRLRNYPGKDGPVDQIEGIIGLLSKTPYTRRAQAITWVPEIDLGHHEPPCFQRLWCQIIDSNGEQFLEMNTHWRSRDAFKAAFMNMYAFIELQKYMAEEISQRTGREVQVGRYTDFVDNFHIYGSYIRRGEMVGFLESLKKRTFSQRTLRSDSEVVLQEFNSALEKLENERLKEERRD